jgi:peptidoglycan/LPS O-acetylase OafA/YrhL
MAFSGSLVRSGIALGLGARRRSAPALARVAADRGFHIASLDGIRAIAALIVFAAHTGLEHLVPGGFGVTVFFFLSGYLITTLLRREYEETGTISLKHFYLRRVYRIFPPLYLVLGILILLALTGVVRNDMDALGIAAQLAHLTNYYVASFPDVNDPMVAPFTVPFWSLAVEEHFYLLFPLALLLLLKRNPLSRVAQVLFLVCCAVLLWRCFLVLIMGAGSHYIYHATDTRIDSLLFGCVMGLWLNPALDPAPAKIPPRTWVLLCGLGLALLLWSFLDRSTGFRDTFRYSLQGLGLFPLFYCAVRFHDWPVFAWLGIWPMRMLGLISYTFYLSHEACIELADRMLNNHGALRALAGFALAVAFSAACYVLVERRFARLRRKLHG